MPSALIITTAGTNCDRELGDSFALAGAAPHFIHLNQLMLQPQLMDEFDLIGLPGGFSYGDAVAAGRIAAHLMRRSLYPSLIRAIQRGVPIIAPCNGFQIAVQLGILPGPGVGEPWPEHAPQPSIALAQNQSGRFIDRWYHIEIPTSTRCIWTQGIDLEGDASMLPVAHGEGRFIPESDDLLQSLQANDQIAVRYATDDTPSGSVDRIAGICDASGLVFGLMPHPERFTRWTQHPWWTRLNGQQLGRPALRAGSAGGAGSESRATTERQDGEAQGEPLGLRMFRNAVNYVQQRGEAVAKSHETKDKSYTSQINRTSFVPSDF